MSLDLTHGFLAELHIRWFVVNSIFAGGFLTRHATSTTTLDGGEELRLWFDKPELRLTGDGGPAGVEVDLFLTARQSDRFDQGRAGFTVRAPIVDRQVSVGGRARACPSADFSAVTAQSLEPVMSTNPAYDDAARTAVANLLRQDSIAVGPLLPAGGKRLYRTYMDVPGHENVGLLAAFVALSGEPMTPPGVDTRLAPLEDAILLVPDDLVQPAIDTGLAKAGRGHKRSREFHVKGCQFGDIIAAANLVLFPTHQAAIQAGYDGCATCQPEFSVAVFGDLNVLIAHPSGVEPDQPVTVRAVYSGNIVRFGIPLAPEPEKIVDATPFNDEGMPTNSATFSNIVPARWVVTVTCGGWSATETVDVHRRFKDATGITQGSVTTVRGTVGEVGLAVE